MLVLYSLVKHIGEKMDSVKEAQRERLFYIEFLAYFTGQVSRKDLVERFGISEPAATKDISCYVALSPNVINYDLRRKCYVYTGGEPQFPYDVDQVLFSLAGERAIAIDTEHASRLPSWVDTSIKRKMLLQPVSKITRCIYQHKTIKASYVSLSSGNRTRTLSPLALVHDGLRWHIRCYDHDGDAYKDYNLSRFNDIEEGDASAANLEDDIEWSAEVILKLVPHPKIEFPESIKNDYDIQGNTKHVPLKKCLVGYFLRHWNIDYSDKATGNPRAQQLYLENKSELISNGVESWAFEVWF